MSSYVLVSKSDSIGNGKKVLMSFAQTPLWKSYYEIKVQGDDIPNCYDLETANYAHKKYANPVDYEVVQYEIIQKELINYEI